MTADWADHMAIELFAAAQLRPGNSFHDALRQIANTLREVERRARMPQSPMLAIASTRTPADDAALMEYGRAMARRAVLAPREIRELRQRPCDTEALQDETQADYSDERDNAGGIGA
jgi:hypothetical protein